MNGAMNGTIILNNSDSNFLALKDIALKEYGFKEQNIKTYGEQPSGDLVIKDFSYHQDNIEVEILFHKKSYKLEFSLYNIALIKVIIAIDIIERKLNLAQKLGATHILNADGSDILSDIMGITNSKGVDYSIEAAGKKETMELAFQSVQDTKGKCIIAGNLSDGEMIEINPMSLIKGKKIVGTWGGETIPDEDIPKYVQWYLSGRIELDQLIKKEYHLHDINLVISDLENGKVDRPLINMNTKILKG